MQKLQELKDVARRFTGLADFAIVYVEEAHATDEWKLVDLKVHLT